MIVLIDNYSGQPIYEQIVDKMSDLMVRGILAEDTPLPSVRSISS